MAMIKYSHLAAVALLSLNSTQLLASPGDRTGTELGVNTFISDNQSAPIIAMDAGGNFVITWQSDTQDSGSFGVYAQRYNTNGSAAGAEFRVNTSTLATQEVPNVAMDADGDFVISWSSTHDGIRNVYAQRYNADGSTAGAEFRVNSYTIGFQSNPDTAMAANGNFIITWNSFGQENNTSGSFGIYAQRYNADGSMAGDEFKANTTTTGNQVAPSIAMDAKGAFVIVWESSDVLIDGDVDIYAQRYDAGGSIMGNEFLVNAGTLGTQSDPDIAMDADGDFAIAWHSDIQKNGNFDIYARRYRADGSAVNITESIVNTVTTGDQASPSIAMDADGDFVISWRSFAQEGESVNDFGVYARRYNANGTAEDINEHLVNTIITGDQEAPSIAMAADNDFVIAWSSDGQDGADNVYAQRYLSADKKTIDLSLVVQDDTDPVMAGNHFVYSFITTNNGNGMALGAKLVNHLPSGLTYISDDTANSDWHCSLAETTLSCIKPLMNATEISTINVTVSATTAGTLSNTVTAGTAQIDNNSADNTDTETTEVSAAPSSESSSSGSLGALSLLLMLPLWLRRKKLF